MKKLALLLLLPLLTGCGVDLGAGGGTNSTNGQFGSQAVRLVAEPGALSSDGGVLQGTGASIFRQTLPGISSDTSYELYFQLNDGGSVTLVSHADDNLRGGFEVSFVRRGAGRGSLQTTLTANGRSRSTVVDRFAVDVFENIDASQPVWLQVDVHNGEAGAAHVVAWNHNESGDDFSPQQALLDTSSNSKSNGSPGKGGGSHWGLRLVNSVVRRALTSPAKLAD